MTAELEQDPAIQTPETARGEGPIPGWPNLAAWDRYRLLSIDFSVQVTDKAMADTIRWHLAPFLLPGIGYAKHGVLISQLEGREEGGFPIFECVLDSVQAEESYLPLNIVRAALEGIYETTARWTKDFLLLHAGAVASAQGALVMPALSNSGKSSTTLSLLRTGAFGYLSDEYAPLDPVTRRVYPLERPIRIDEESVGSHPGLEALLRDLEPPVRQIGRYVRPQDVGAGVAGPSRVRWFVLLSGDWDGPPRLTPRSPTDAVREMAGNSHNFPLYGERGLHLLADIARNAEVFELRGGSPQDRAELVADRLA
jgi:hypothetical protein